MTPTAAYEHVPGLKGLQVLTCVLIVVMEILGLGRWKSKKCKTSVEGVMYKLASLCLCR